jgi:hypothetical protein
MWLRLDMACHMPACQAGIHKVERSLQRNEQVRFDLFVLMESVATIQQRLHAFACRWSWHIRNHVPFELRGLAPPARTPPAPPPAATINCRQHLRVGTFNINGVRSKQSDLWELLQSQRLDVLALQETLLKATDWDLSVRDYLCFSALGHTAASQRGVSILVNRNLNSQVVGPSSPFWVFVRVSGTAHPAPVIIGSVYLPHQDAQQSTRRRLAAALVHIHAKSPDCAIILMGDLNADLEGSQRLAQDWPGTFEVLANQGGVPTSRRTGG